MISYGYRTKAQRVAEFKMVAKNCGLTLYETKKLLTTIGNVCDDLDDCCKIRSRMRGKLAEAGMVSDIASITRKQKATK